MSWDYSDKTKQLFMDAMKGKSGTHLGEIENPDAVGSDGSIVCGDALKIFLKIEKDESNPVNDKIKEIKFQTFGCTSAIASSEALCQMIEARNYSPIDALQIQNKDIVEFLGGLPDQKIHCSVMGAKALENAVYDWAEKRGVNLKSACPHSHEDEDEGRIVCDCFSLTEPYLKRIIKELNLKTVEEITNATKAGGACGSCIDRPNGIRDILKEVIGDQPVEEESAKEDTSNLDIEDNVKEVIAEKIRPYLQLHGGDIELIEVKNELVYCTLKGSCSSCAGAQMTLQNIVEKQLQEFVDERIKVINI